jgi:hypothetical protein
MAIMLAALAAPVLAQTDADLCLTVQAAPGVDLTDASAVQDGIGTGEILVTAVVPCDAAAAPGATTAPVSEVGTGAWIVGPIEVDPMTDDRRAVASLVAASGTDWFGAPFTLTIGCTDGSTKLTVDWIREELGPENLVNVDTRIGDGEVTTEPWFNGRHSTSYGGSETAFIESLFGQTQLAHRVQVTDGRLATAVFDITGIENAVANVRETCGW